MEGVLGADFSVKHHWNLSQKLLELDSGNKLHQIIAKTLVGDVDHLADFQKAEVKNFWHDWYRFILYHLSLSSWNFMIHRVNLRKIRIIFLKFFRPDSARIASSVAKITKRGWKSKRFASEKEEQNARQKLKRHSLCKSALLANFLELQSLKQD